MKVLFVSSGNKAVGKCSSFVQSQYDSLVAEGLDMQLYPVVGHGAKSFFKHLRALRRTIKTWRPDVVHAHYSTFGILVSLSMMGMCHKPKIVVSILGSFPTHSVKWRYVRFFVKYVWDKTITKSKRTADQLGFDLPVIPNGVNTDIFHPMDQEEAREKLNLATIASNLSPVGTLCRPLTTNQSPIIIWCSNPEREEKNWPLAQRAVEILQSQITNHKLQITLLPVFNKTPQEVATYMNAADVMLLTSMSEGSPNVVKEALACNCPIVTTDVGDVHERLDGVEGCYVIPTDNTPTYGRQGVGEWFEKDAEQLAECLEKAISFNKRTKGIDKLQSDKLEVAQIADKIIEVYKQI